VQRVLAERNVPSQAVTLRLQSFEGPYCGAIDILRQVAAGPGQSPQVAIIGTLPLQRADLLRLEVQMPAYAGQLQVSYIMKSNEIVHLVPSQPHPAGARIRLGEPAPGFPGWEVDEPFGTDLIVAFASQRPLFAQPRPQIESLDDFLPALAAALREARMQGSQVSARALVVETVPNR
jgi:serine/threonine-protein kinase